MLVSSFLEVTASASAKDLVYVLDYKHDWIWKNEFLSVIVIICRCRFNSFLTLYLLNEVLKHHCSTERFKVIFIFLSVSILCTQLCNFS